MSLNLQPQSRFNAKASQIPESLDACLSHGTLPLVATLVIGCFRREEGVASKPHSDCPGFDLSEQCPNWKLFLPKAL